MEPALILKPALPTGWRILPDAEAVAAEAANLITAAGSEALAARGVFRLVLAGGRTPEAAYRRLVQRDIDWGRWELFLGDERCLPVGHPDRNSRMVWEALVSQWGPGPASTEPSGSEPPGVAPEVSGPQGAYPEANFSEANGCGASRSTSPGVRFYAIPAELGAELAAARYGGLVARASPFDLVLLGMGEDGHTASLFPGLPLGANDWTVAVHGAPKPPPERVSLGLRALRAARQRLVLVTGASKREAIDRWRAGADLPIARACQGLATQVLLDREAAPPGLFDGDQTPT